METSNNFDIFRTPCGSTGWSSLMKSPAGPNLRTSITERQDRFKSLEVPSSRWQFRGRPTSPLPNCRLRRAHGRDCPKPNRNPGLHVLNKPGHAKPLRPADHLPFVFEFGWCFRRRRLGFFLEGLESCPDGTYTCGLSNQCPSISCVTWRVSVRRGRLGLPNRPHIDFHNTGEPG